MVSAAATGNKVVPAKALPAFVELLHPPPLRPVAKCFTKKPFGRARDLRVGLAAPPRLGVSAALWLDGPEDGE
jgi:hypothetical protein